MNTIRVGTTLKSTFTGVSFTIEEIFIAEQEGDGWRTVFITDHYGVCSNEMIEGGLNKGTIVEVKE
jgi:hypothetical protein